MNPFSPSVSSMTGMARPKTRRGGRRSRGGQTPVGSPQTHVENIQKALSTNDFAGAKPHAFALVRSLHAAAPPAPKPEQSDESGGDDMAGKNWIAGATQNKGALHKQLGVPEGQKIPAKKLSAAANSSDPLEAKRARLAQTLKSLKK